MMSGEGRARSELTRQRILDATIDTLVEGGFTHATMRTVAARAATSVGAVQYHFPSKQALLLETLTEIFQEGIERLAALGGGEPQAARARGIVRTLWAFYSGPRYLAASEILLGTRMEQDASRPMLRARDLLTRAYQAAWDQALAGSPLPAGERLTFLQLVCAALRGMALLAVHERDPEWFEPQLLALEGLVERVLAEGRLPEGRHSDGTGSGPAREARPRRLALV